MNTLKTAAATRQNPGYRRSRGQYGKSILLIAALLVSMISSTHAVNEDTKLLASDGAADDYFGKSVSVSSDKIVVGATGDDNTSGTASGSAYVYDWNGTQWLETKLTASDGAADDRFGESVSVSGNRILVGAILDDDNGSNSGSAYVYDWDGTQWLETKLTASDGAVDDRFGISASVSGDRIVIGADRDDDNGSGSGSAYVYDWNGTQWTETKLTASDRAADDWFGRSVSVSGNRIVVGALKDDNSGSAYVYDWNGTQWLETKLTASDGAVDDRFGISASVSGDRIVIGADRDDDRGSASGSAYVYDWNGTQWTETKLTASDGAADDWFGKSVSVSGDRIVVGAWRDDDSGSASGSAYVYDWNGTQWIETKLTASDGAADDLFGKSASVSGNRIVVGAVADDDKGSDSGSVYIFKGPPTWLATNGTDLFLQDGSVAIGTDTVPAAYKLAVNGKIIAEEVTVELSANWPDYVFEDGYDLLSLDAVEAHITNHRHLPDMPSSREIQDAGLSISDMLVKQMQKIEELTLYAIRQNKKIEILEGLVNENKSLKHRVKALEGK